MPLRLFFFNTQFAVATPKVKVRLRGVKMTITQVFLYDAHTSLLERQLLCEPPSFIEQ